MFILKKTSIPEKFMPHAYNNAGYFLLIRLALPKIPSNLNFS